MPDPSKPVPLEAEAVEAAIRASYDDQPQWFSGTMTRPSEHRPKTFEQCYGCAPLEHADSRKDVELIIHAFLDAMGMRVEHSTTVTRIATNQPPLEQRLVSDWFPIKGPVDE